MASESVENYIKAIYKLEQAGGRVTNRAIADRLSVSPPSVSRMVKRLSENDWVVHHPYRGVRLTDRGRRNALRVIRNHRILETYFAEILGMSWDQVDAEVERLEHVVSDELINRMEEALRFPKHDPHGSPIPDREGNIAATDSIPIVEVPEGAEARVARIADASPEALAYLESEGLVPGARLTSVVRQPFEGPLHVCVERGDAEPASVYLGSELASRIRVHVDLSPSNDAADGG